jgi:hypothetical protein
MRALFLYDVLKDAGLDVIAVQGWQARGGELEDVAAILWHHDAMANTGDMPSLPALVAGRKTPTPVPGPLAQLGLGRSGKWYVIAAGKANHAGAGLWRGVNRSNRTIGIEAANNGVDEPWPDRQVDSYVHGTAAILKHVRLSADAVCGHKEWAIPKGRKIDPRPLDMAEMRQRVHWAMNAPDWKVKPMWDPAPPIAAGCIAPKGGAWLVSPDGAVFTIEPAPYLGGAYEKPYFRGRKAARIDPAGEGYVITATSGETYHYPEA